MIEYKMIDIKCIEDWDMLPIDDIYINEDIIRMLKQHIGTKCEKIVVEYPYYDSDYLSTYYMFYSRKNRNFIKQSCRIHLFNHNNQMDEYRGFLTLRPTIGETKIGKTYLDPNIYFPEKAYIMMSDYKVHLRGQDFKVSGFPWMRQETDITVCAHVAMWSILRYYGNKYSNYKDITMGDIIELMPESVGRKFPTKAISMQQIPDVFKELGFSPIVIRKKNGSDEAFRNELFTYIESGIPLVACMSKKNHAIALIGHGEINYKKAELLSDKRFLLTSELQDTLIIQDDNIFPYQKLSYSDVNPFNLQENMNSYPYILQDIDYLVVPLYNRMQLSYEAVVCAYKLFLRNTPDFLCDNKQYFVRIYITSANSFKRSAYNSRNMNSNLERIISSLEMPKFIWCVDISTKEEYKKGLLSARFIFDSTCCNKELLPMILFHNSKKITYYDNIVNTWNELDLLIEPYDLYINNLKEVYNGE